jgi:hypothetical protein
MVASFGIYETVSTVYGPGYVAEIRQNDYVIKLANWALAQGQSPTLYLAADAIKSIPGAMVGTTVDTVYGPSNVQSIRGDGTHVARPLNWKLANNTVATLYLQSDAVKLYQTGGFSEGDEVMTVFGRGFIESKRVKEGDLVIKLHYWALAQRQSPTCYMQPENVVKIHNLQIGSIAKTCWGLVRVLDIKRDGQHKCEAVHWVMADGKNPTFYLAPEAFALMSLKP